MMSGSYSPTSSHRALLNILIVLTILLVPATAFGQTPPGSLEVTVSDPGGAVIIGAIITLENEATGFNVSQTTDDNGRALFASLPPGTYSVRVSANNFMETTTEA